MAAVLVCSLRSARLSAELFAFATLDAKADTAFRSLLELMTFGLYGGASARQADVEVLLERLAWLDGFAWLFFGVFVVLVGMFLVLSWRRAGLAGDLVALSALLLVAGLFAPMLTVVFFQDFPVVGNTVFDFKSQGILASIGSLFVSGNWVVAFLLLLFSVLTPLLKIGVSVFALSRQSSLGSATSLLSQVAKWSMLDVFVVAILLAVFVLGSSSFVDASVGLGLYFFAAYCVASIVSSQLVAKQLASPS